MNTFKINDYVQSDTDPLKYGFVRSFDAIGEVTCVTITLADGQPFVTTLDDLNLISASEEG
jgi:hypothetical protein